MQEGENSYGQLQKYQIVSIRRDSSSSGDLTAQNPKK